MKKVLPNIIISLGIWSGTALSQASAGCTDCKKIKAQGPDLSWKLPVESRTPAQSEDRIVGQTQTPEERAGYNRISVSRRDDSNEKVYSCEDSLPIGSPLRATGIIVMADNEEQFKKEKWKYARGSIQMIGECHALTVAHAMIDQSTYDYLKPLTIETNVHEERLESRRKIINEGLRQRSKSDTAYRVCIKRKSNSMNFDTEKCDRIEKVIAFDLSPDSDLALVRLANCRGSDSTVGHFDIATPQEVYEYLIKDEIVRSNIAIALTGFAGDRSGCTLSVDTCNPGRRELQNRTANMICNSVAGQSGGALSIVFDQSGQIVSQSDIRESPETPNLKYKVIGIAKETHFSEAPLEDRTSADRFFVAKQFKQKSNREYANNYYEFDRSDIRKIKNAISKDYEENKAQIDANIAQMKMQGEVELAEELKQQKARSRNNY